MKEAEDIPSSTNWSELTFVEPYQLGVIIGFGGNTINRIKEKYNVKIETHANAFYIYGDINDDNNKKAIEEIKTILELSLIHI